MYKVVLIDDEPIILEGMTRGMDWAKWDCRVIGTASDGREGRKLIDTLHPNIVFTDIAMPQMDGLSMLAAIESEYPKIQVAILTGYRNFEYAQTAIRLGVSRFLSKPSKMVELEEAVSFMTGRLREQGIEAGEAAPRPGKTKGDAGGQAEAFAAPAASAKEGLETTGTAGPETVPAAGEQPAVSPASNFIVKNALRYIDDHFTEKLMLSDVADHVYVSQWHLSKLLNSRTGQSFSDLLNTKRIIRAKELLEDPTYRIGDIAEAVGFMDIAHFSRVFKKITGVSANTYRNTIP